MTEVFIVAGVRTAIGTFGGSLKDTSPGDLGALVAGEAVKRSGVQPKNIGHVVFGQVIHTEPRDMYISRVVAVNAGIPVETPALTVNRLCGSGLQAIVSAAQAIKLGDCEVALAGGVESMSRAPYATQAMRFGARMGDTALVDMMTGALNDPFHRYHMGITAENVAERYGVSREDQDALAVESHRRASAAIKAGYFKDQIVGVELKTGKGVVTFAEDEHVRHETSIDDLKGMKPVFKKEGGTVTAGNASGINDGAGALVLAGEAAVKKGGLKPLARLVGYAHAGVDPAFMGIGPIPATKAVLARTGLNVSQLDVVEANEAFAAQACAVSRQLELDPAKVNPNGSGISLGHPVGATGAIIAVKLINELARTGGRYGLATMCIGGGQGIALVFERV